MPVCISVHHTHAWGLRKLERGFRTLELGFQSSHVGTNITEKANNTLDPSIKALDIYETLPSRATLNSVSSGVIYGYLILQTLLGDSEVRETNNQTRGGYGVRRYSRAFCTQAKRDHPEYSVGETGSQDGEQSCLKL